MKLMITNGGPHPADKWADVTVGVILDLIQISDNSVSPEAMAARQAKRDLRPKLFDALIGHHSAVQHKERESLKAIKSAKAAGEHCDGKHDPHAHGETEATCDMVCGLLADTPFAAHFAKPEVEAVVHQIIKQHTVNAMHIERRWHHDRLTAKGA